MYRNLLTQHPRQGGALFWVKWLFYYIKLLKWPKKGGAYSDGGAYLGKYGIRIRYFFLLELVGIFLLKSLVYSSCRFCRSCKFSSLRLNAKFAQGLPKFQHSIKTKMMTNVSSSTKEKFQLHRLYRFLIRLSCNFKRSAKKRYEICVCSKWSWNTF